MAAHKRVRVWDRFVRLFHWGLVTSMAVAYLSTVGSQHLHNAAGYAALVLVVARVVWGFVGAGHARFADFVPGPRKLLRYTWDMLHRREPRYIGHNPAAAVMILFLLAAVVGIGVSGWMLTLDAFWGSEAVEFVHVLLVNVTLAAVAIHVCAAVYESFKHRENLVWSMVVGSKREQSDSPTDRGSADEAGAEVPERGRVVRPVRSS